MVFGFDRATKLYIESALSPFENINVISGLFSITRTENTGMAFSLLTGYPELLAGVATIVIALIAYMLWTATSGRIPLALVLGGALGNLYDRFTKGAVTDFLDVYWRDHHWPTFNVADSAITIGAILLLIGSFRNVPETIQHR
jgi:signal peptidase II